MKELYKALLAFQQEVPTIKKNATGYGYKFADLDEIDKVIKPILKKNGLGYIQPIEGKQIKTIVFHAESGESIESSADIPQGVQLAKMNEFQVLGSAITYLRRYSLSSILGLITDEDADAAGEQVKVAQPKTREEGHDQEILARAKSKINTELEAQGYDNAQAKIVFITSVLEKATIDNLDDCDLVMDAIENVDSPINRGEQHE